MKNCSKFVKETKFQKKKPENSCTGVFKFIPSPSKEENKEYAVEETPEFYSIIPFSPSIQISEPTIPLKNRHSCP